MPLLWSYEYIAPMALLICRCSAAHSMFNVHLYRIFVQVSSSIKLDATAASDWADPLKATGDISDLNGFTYAVNQIILSFHIQSPHPHISLLYSPAPWSPYLFFLCLEAQIKTMKAGVKGETGP